MSTSTTADEATRLPVGLLTATVINSVGDGAFYVTAVLFLTEVTGLSPAQVGLGLSVGWAAGFLASTPLGALADRCGLRRAAAALAAGTAVALLALLTVGSFAGFLAVAVGYGCCQSGLGAVRQALLTALAPAEHRTTVRARLQAGQNAGLAVGAAIGGVALTVDSPAVYRLVLGLDAAAFLTAAILLPTLGPVVTARPAVGRRLAVLSDRPYAVLAGLNAVMLLYMPLLSVALPLWVVQHTAAPAWLVSALFIGNTLAVMLGQIHVTRRIPHFGAAGRAVRLAGLIMFAACAIFAWSGVVATAVSAVGLLVLAAGLQIVAEMLSASGSWQIAFDLAPDGRQGQYQGLYAAGVPLARAAGPALLTGLLLSGGTAGWLLLGTLFLGAGALTVPAVRAARKAGTNDRCPSIAGSATLAPCPEPTVSRA